MAELTQLFALSVRGAPDIHAAVYLIALWIQQGPVARLEHVLRIEPMEMFK